MRRHKVCALLTGCQTFALPIFYRNWLFPVQSLKFGVFITFQQHAHQLYAGLFTEGVDKPAPDQKCCPTICSNAFSADMPSRINWLISCENLLMPSGR